uniref:RIIa domain-containing protein n=1 Tax=Lates calcarifer TaxID=8187 RepID=A0A4W6EQW4_LATCA
MSFQNLCPYGLKSIVECITRATLISQPTDIPDFIYQYLSGLIKFRESLPEADPKDLSFHYQKQNWNINKNICKNQCFGKMYTNVMLL